MTLDHLDIASRHGVTRVRVVGSFARGDARSDSDLDLLIDLLIEAGLPRTPFFPQA